MSTSQDTQNNGMRSAFLFILPLLLLLIVFIFTPIVGTIINSFYQDIPYMEQKFIMFENYKQIFVDTGFKRSLIFTLLFTGVTVPIELALGLMFALILHQNIPFRGLMRAIVLLPWAIPSAISARVWELIFNYNYGLANFFCTQLGVTHQPVNWLGSEAGAFIALVISDVWKTTPFVAIILLAGLQAIPQELYAQAQIDMANSIQRFFKITLPLLKPVLVVALLFRTIDALRIFDLVYVLTHGGPGGSTTSLSLYSYQYFLAGDFGYGSAVSVILFCVAFCLSLIYVKLSQFRREII